MARDILIMPFEKGFSFYVKAHNEIRNEKLFLRWINGYQTQMTFDKFKQEVTGQIGNEHTTEPKSEEEILQKVKNILS